MARTDLSLVSKAGEIEQQFRSIMRRLAGGVSVITAGRGNEITGMTVSSLISLSAAPPRVLVSVSRASSPFALIEGSGLFGVNILGSSQHGIANRFSNGRLQGHQRFEGLEWHHGPSGVPLLKNTTAAIECEVEEIIERHSHGIVIGRLLSFELSPQLSGLAYWNSQYFEIDKSDFDLLAEVSIPLAHVR